MEDTSAKPTGTKQVKIARVQDVPEGESLEAHADGHRIALFHVPSGFYAISGSCVHRGGPLSEGELNGYMVTCPWHGWKYDIRTGAFEIIPTLKIKSYKVERKGDDLYVDLE